MNLSHQTFVSASARDELRLRLYNEFYAKNSGLFKEDPVGYWHSAGRYVDKKFGEEVKKLEQTFQPTIELQKHEVQDKEFKELLCKTDPDELEFYGRLYVAKGQALFLTAARGKKWAAIDSLMERYSNPMPTKFDDKEFKGEDVITAMKIYLKRQQGEFIEMIKNAPSLDIINFENNQIPIAIQEFLIKLANCHYVMQAVPRMITHKIRPGSLLQYQQLRMYAGESGISIPEFNNALIETTAPKELVLPYLVLGVNVTPLAVRLKRGWAGLLGKGEVIVQPLKGIEGLIGEIPAAQISEQKDSQVMPHAQWMKEIASSIRKLPDTVKEIDEKLEGLLVPEPQKA